MLSDLEIGFNARGASGGLRLPKSGAAEAVWQREAPAQDLCRGGRLVVGGQRVDDRRHFGDFAERYAALFRVLSDRRLVFGQINAKGFVRRDIAVLPLDAAAKVTERLIRGPRRAAQFGN